MCFLIVLNLLRNDDDYDDDDDVVDNVDVDVATCY